MSVDLYFLRHGETDYNKNGRIQGRIDIPLNDTGRSQAAAVASYFSRRQIVFDQVYASPLQRARETAAIASGWAIDQVVPDERVKEVSFGESEGAKVEDLSEGFMNLFYAPERYEVPKDGETIDALQARCQSFLDELAMRLDGETGIKNILVTTHGAALRGVISCIEKSERKDFWVQGLGNCFVIKTTFSDGVYKGIAIDDPLKEQA